MKGASRRTQSADSASTEDICSGAPLVPLPCAQHEGDDRQHDRHFNEDTNHRCERRAGLEAEERDGAVHLSFDEPPGRFVISPNAPVRQIWVSALSTSFKLDWSEIESDFVFTKTGERLKPLIGRLINEQLGAEAVTLK